MEIKVKGLHFVGSCVEFDQFLQMYAKWQHLAQSMPAQETIEMGQEATQNNVVIPNHPEAIKQRMQPVYIRPADERIREIPPPHDKTLEIIERIQGKHKPNRPKQYVKGGNPEHRQKWRVSEEEVDAAINRAELLVEKFIPFTLKDLFGRGVSPTAATKQGGRFMHWLKEQPLERVRTGQCYTYYPYKYENENKIIASYPDKPEKAIVGGTVAWRANQSEYKHPIEREEERELMRG